VVVNKQQIQELRDRLVEITAQGQTILLSQAAQQREWLDIIRCKIAASPTA
jgi:DNA repair protein RecN (Recombination protein N)